MSWQQWFDGRDPASILMVEVWAEAGRRALAEANCRVGWLPSGAVVDVPGRGPVEGFAERAGRRVYSPPPDCVSNLALLLHEVGHVATDFGTSELESEARANVWALEFWRRHDLPDVEQARFSLARRMEGSLRREVGAGKVTPAQALAAIPDALADLIDTRWLAAPEAA